MTSSLLAAASAPLLLAVLVASTPAQAGIIDSHHDFSSLGASDGEACSPCHTPHAADSSVISDGPLWNHEVSTATFTTYNSDTMDSVPGQPTGTSILCLSCHDGTVAIDSFGGMAGSVYISDSYYTYSGDTLDSYFTTDLTGDHPISMEYNSAVAAADGHLNDPSTTSSGLGGTIAEDMLHNGKVECTSCHDPHVGRSTGCESCHFGLETKSLVMDNTSSALCLTCHAK